MTCMTLNLAQREQVNLFLMMFKVLCDEVKYRDPLVAEAMLEIEKMMHTYLNEISSRITFKAARKNRAMSIDEVAAITGVEKQLIDDIEENFSDIYIDLVMKLCKCYCISPDHIRFQK